MKFDRSENLMHFFNNKCNENDISLPEQEISEKLKYDYIFIWLDKWLEKQIYTGESNVDLDNQTGRFVNTEVNGRTNSVIRDGIYTGTHTGTHTGTYTGITSQKIISGLSSYINKLAKRNLSPSGRIVLLCDNALGLHEFAKGLPVEAKGQEHYFTYQLLKDVTCQIENAYVKWYYPYPNIEITQAVYSDLHLPSHGECDENFYNFDKAMLECFDEQKITDEVTTKGMYPYLANAYMLVIGFEQEDLQLPYYVRFSNERRVECQVQTELYKAYVTKRAYTDKALQHMEALREYSVMLSKELCKLEILNRPLQVNSLLKYDETKGAADFEYVNGVSLEEILDEMMQAGDFEKVSEILNSLCKGIRELATGNTFIPCDEFYKVFGNTNAMQEVFSQSTFYCLSHTDIDMICQNILIDENRAVLIDYEWTFSFPVPVDYLIYRILFFFLEGKNRTLGKQKQYKSLYSDNGITESLIQIFGQMETAFQLYVQEGACIVRNEYDLHGRPVITHDDLNKMRIALEHQKIVVNQENVDTINYFGKKEDKVISYKISADSDTVFIDISNMFTKDTQLFRVGLLAAGDGQSHVPEYEIEAENVAGMMYLFDRQKARICVHVKKGEQVLLSLEEIEISEYAQRELLETIKDLRFLVDNREEQLSQMRNSASWKVTAPLRKIKGQK